MTESTRLQQHLCTKAAAEALGIADSTIRKWSGLSGEPGVIFREGDHWRRRGEAPQSPRIYDIRRCAEEMQLHGYYIPETTRNFLTADA